MARSQMLWRRPPARRPLDREIARLAIPAFGALIAEPLYVLSDFLGR
jgi:Na+-driven multidrug efflux pump